MVNKQIILYLDNIFLGNVRLSFKKFFPVNIDYIRVK